MVAEIQKIPDRFHNYPSYANGLNKDEKQFLPRFNRSNGLKKFEPFMLGLENNKIYSLKSFPLVRNKNGPIKLLLKADSYDSTSSLTDDDINNTKSKILPSLGIEKTVPAKINAREIPKFITKYHHFITCQVEMTSKKDKINDISLKEITSTKISSYLKLAIGLEGFEMIKYICKSQDIIKNYRDMLPLVNPDNKLNSICQNAVQKDAAIQVSTLQLFYDNTGNVCQLNVFHLDNENISIRMKRWLLDSLADLYEICLRHYLNSTYQENIIEMIETKKGDFGTQTNRMHKTNQTLQQLTSLHERILNLENHEFFDEFERLAPLIKEIYEQLSHQKSSVCDSILFQIFNLLGPSTTQKESNPSFTSDLTIYIS